MNANKILIIAGLLALVATGCQTAPKPSAGFADLTTKMKGVAVTNELDAALLQPPQSLFTLGPGDKIEIEIIGIAKSRTATSVGPDGKIYFQLLPGLDVWGLTLDQTRELIQTSMAKYLNEPQVAVYLREVGSRHVWVLGRLNKPGVYPLSAPMTLLEAVAQAGGTAQSASQVTTEELADLRHSFVMRKGQMVPVDFYRLLREGDASQNVYLLPDDFVYVRSAIAQEVYVLGAVKAPRSIPYSEHMTLMTALAGASGHIRMEWFNTEIRQEITPDARLSEVAIVRGSLSTPEMMVVDAGAIMKGKAVDVRLEPGDIVYVPNAPVSTLKRYVNMIVNSFVTTLAANEGVAAGGGQVGVGVSVPVSK